MKSSFSLFVVSLSLVIGQLLNAQPRPQSEIGVANPLTHTTSVLAPLWPLRKQRASLQNIITELELELLLVDSKQQQKVPDDAQGDLRKRLEEENARSAQKALQMQDRIESVQRELDGVNRQIEFVKKKAQINGVVVL